MGNFKYLGKWISLNYLYKRVLVVRGNKWD